MNSTPEPDQTPIQDLITPPLAVPKPSFPTSPAVLPAPDIAVSPVAVMPLAPVLSPVLDPVTSPTTAAVPALPNTAPATAASTLTPTNRGDVAVDYSAYTKAQNIPQRYLVICITFVFGFFIGVGGFSALSKHNPGVAILFFLLAFLSPGVAIVSGLIYAFKVAGVHRQELDQFLIDNGWVRMLTSPDIDVATSLLGIGYACRIVGSFGGYYRGAAFTASHYVYETGEGKNRQTHNYLNMRFPLSLEFPLVVLDDKTNNTAFGSNLPERIGGGKSLQLEGDFNQRFKVTIMPGTEQVVLELLTPDFMQDLMGNPGKADIELEANQLFVISNGSAFKNDSLHNMFSAADVMLKNISEVSKSWQASVSKDSMNQMVSEALAPRTGRMLHPRHIGYAGIIGFILIALFQLFVNGGLKAFTH